MAVPAVLVAVVGEHVAECPPRAPEDLIFKVAKGRRYGETTSIDQCVGPNAWPRPGCLRASGSRVCAALAHVAGLIGGEHAGADASDGAREYAPRIYQHATMAGSRDCGCDRCANRTRP